MVYNGTVYYRANMANLNYKVNLLDASTFGSLIDGGANGGMAGADTRLLSISDTRMADISTADHNNTIKNLKIGLFAGKVKTTQGYIVLLLGEYAHNPTATTTIHSALQIRSFGHDVDDVPIMLGGMQRIKTSCNRIIPLSIRNGLAYLEMTPPTDDDINTLPQVYLTADEPWDPSLFDKGSDDGSVHTLPEDDFGNDIDDRVDQFGNIIHIETNIEACIRDAGEPWDDD